MSQPERPLRVTLDVWDVGSPKPRGVVNLKRQFSRACALLAQSGDLHVCYAGGGADRDWLLDEGLLGYGTFHRFRIPGRLQRIAAQIKFLPLSKLLGQPDLYHYFGLYPFSSGRMRVVGTLLDFVPMRVPQFVPLDFTLDQVRWCRWAASHPDARWIAISEQTKRDALALARLREDQVSVVNLCADDDMFSQPAVQEVASTLESIGVHQPYLLCVNTLNFRKNHIRLLEAWEQGDFARQGWTLVLVGRAAGHPIANKLRSGGFDGVTWLGYLPRQQLVHLYYGCEAFVYPSLYEGFGIPVAEAIVAGKAVLTSHRSAMADIAGEGAICIDPWDTISLMRGLSELINNPSLRMKLVEYNTAQRQKFSSKRMAESLLEAYRHILE